MKYTKLFEPGKIGTVKIGNRVVMTAMEVDLGRFDGKVSQRLSDYYYERARGGVGLIITGIARVDSFTGVGSPMQLSVANFSTVRSLRKLTKRIHTTNTKIFCQIHHPGRQSYSAEMYIWPLIAAVSKFPGFGRIFGPMVSFYRKWMKLTFEPAVVSASAVKCTHVNQKVRALKTFEVRRLVKKFIRGAQRVQAAGFDGVEIHAAHGYLIQQFLSPRTNKRTDEYGGSFENRFRFLKEIIEGVRNACGKDFPISLRLSVDEFYRDAEGDEQGITLPMGIKIAEAAAALGIDALNVSSATYETINDWLEPITYEPGWRAYLAKAVKEKVSVPVIAANLIRSAEQAEKQLEEGIQDFIGMGRPFLCDPELVQKISEEREEEIVSCIGCLYCFESLLAGAWKGKPLECARNPVLGQEQILREMPKDGAGRRVVVIGAGPAGLAAAYYAALRGFDVDVYEKEAESGGQVLLAEKPDGKLRLGDCIREDYRRCLSLGVRFHFNQEADAESVLKTDPERVIVAVGSQPFLPPIKGREKSNCYSVETVLNGGVSFRNKTVSVIGSGLTGLETAAFLAERGNRVIVIEMCDEIAPGAYIQNVEDALARLKKHKAQVMVSRKLEEIKENSVEVTDLKENKREEIACDAVVLAVGNRSRRELYEELKKRGVKKLFLIGDAVRPGKIADAVRTGYRAAVEK